MEDRQEIITEALSGLAPVKDDFDRGTRIADMGMDETMTEFVVTILWAHFQLDEAELPGDNPVTVGELFEMFGV